MSTASAARKDGVPELTRNRAHLLPDGDLDGQTGCRRQAASREAGQHGPSGVSRSAVHPMIRMCVKLNLTRFTTFLDFPKRICHTFIITS
jgi:hypothetical protein